MALLDTKMVIWLVSLVFCAGGGWMKLGYLGDRVTKLELKQDGLSDDIQIMIKNQSKMCQALKVDCK